MIAARAALRQDNIECFEENCRSQAATSEILCVIGPLPRSMPESLYADRRKRSLSLDIVRGLLRHRLVAIGLFRIKHDLGCRSRQFFALSGNGEQKLKNLLLEGGVDLTWRLDCCFLILLDGEGNEVVLSIGETLHQPALLVRSSPLDTAHALTST